MTRDDLRLEVLAQARRLLMENGRATSAESEELLKLLDVLVDAIQRNANPEEAAQGIKPLAADLVQNRTLVYTLKQQADELDALKKLSLNLTSRPRPADRAGRSRD